MSSLPVVSDSGKMADSRVSSVRKKKIFFVKQEGASPILKQCSPVVSESATDLTFDPDKLTVTPRPRKGDLGFSREETGQACRNRKKALWHRRIFTQCR